MSITKGNWRDELCRQNKKLDVACQSRWGISVEVFKTIKALCQFLGVAFAMYLVVEGNLDPEFALIMIGVFIGGPDYFEAYLTKDQ